MTTPGAHCTSLRVEITQHPLHTAFLPMMVHSQASPLLHTPPVLMPLSSQDSLRATVLVHTQDSLRATVLVRTQDSLTLVGLLEPDTQIPLPCLRSSLRPSHQTS